MGVLTERKQISKEYMKAVQSAETKEELLEYLSHGVREGREAREMHKALKRFDRKDGLPMSKRYPYLPVQISAVAIILQIAALIFAILWR